MKYRSQAIKCESILPWLPPTLSGAGQYNFCICLGANFTHQAINLLRVGPTYVWDPTLIARFMGPTWGPSGADRTQVGPHVGPMNFAIWGTIQWLCLQVLDHEQAHHCVQSEDIFSLAIMFDSYLSVRLLTHICVTWSQWVNAKCSNARSALLVSSLFN